MSEWHTCRTGHHAWFDPEDARRCCNPEYVRVTAATREELEAMGAENIVLRHWYHGWRKVEPAKEQT